MLREQLEKDYIAEVKARNASVVSTLRMLRAAIKYEEIDKGKELNDEMVIAIIGREVKKLKDSLQSFKDAGRDEMAEDTAKEVAVLEAYLPAQLSDDELREMVEKAIAGFEEITPADFGKVMGAAMKETKGQADGTRVSAMVKELLKG